MWLKASTRVAFNVTIPQRLRLFAEVAAGWINKPPPQEKKEASIVPGSSFTPSFAGWLPRNYLQKRNSAFADHGAIVCVGAHSAAPSVFAPSHTCVNLSYLPQAAHLSTPRNNFAESHGVIRIRGSGWLARNTSRVLDAPMVAQRPNQTWGRKGKGLDHCDETFTGFRELGRIRFRQWMCIFFCHS